MADQEKIYGTNGSAAYRVYETRLDGTTAVKPVHVDLPEEQKEPEKKRLERARLVISPFAAIGLIVVVALLAMVVYGYVQLFETTSRLGVLNEQLAENKAEITKRQSYLESKIDLSEVEARARELGMRTPTIKQKVYLNLAGADRTEVYRADERNVVEKTWDAIVDSFNGILEYFR